MAIKNKQAVKLAFTEKNFPAFGGRYSRIVYTFHWI